MFGSDKLLIHAIEDEDWDLAKKLIRKKRGIYETTEDGDTPLHIALCWGVCGTCERRGIVKLLLEKGADVNSRNNDGETPLHRHCFRKEPFCDYSCMNFLFKYGVDVNARDQNGATALYNAAESNDNEIIKLLLAKGADPRISCKIPLRDCRAYGIFLNNGEVLFQDDDKTLIIDTPFEKAVRKVKRDIVVTFLKYGLEPTIFSAISLNDKNVVMEILETGISIDQLNNIGSSALHVAANEGLADIVEILLEAGANIDLKDANGFSPLRLTAWRIGSSISFGQNGEDDFDKTVAHLLKYGAKADDIWSAVIIDDAVFVKKCLDDGINLNIRMDRLWGESLLVIAIKWNAIDSAKLLIEYGADVNERCSAGGTPLDFVSDNEIAEILKKNGAKHFDDIEQIQEEQRLLATAFGKK